MRAIGSFSTARAGPLGGGRRPVHLVLTPVIFAAYSRNTAGEIVGTMMPHYFTFQFAAAATVALVTIALWRAWPGRRRTLCLVLVLGALAVQSFVQWRLYPRILEVKARVEDVRVPARMPPAQALQQRLHGASMALNLLLLADGTLLLALARRPE